MCFFPAVGDVLVDFVGDGERVELLAQIAHQGKFFAGEDFYQSGYSAC